MRLALHLLATSIIVLLEGETAATSPSSAATTQTALVNVHAISSAGKVNSTRIQPDFFNTAPAAAACLYGPHHSEEKARRCRG